jgi:hypothetical protein
MPDDAPKELRFPLPLKLTITLDENGTCNVEGPINNLAVCYMLMRLGEDAIKLHGERQKKIIAAGAEFLKGLPTMSKM